MNINEYIEIAQGELNNFRSNKLFQDSLFHLVGDSLLSQIDDNYKPATDTPLDDLISIAYRIEQVAIRLYNDVEHQQQCYPLAKEAFESAAKLFEQIAESQLEFNSKIYLEIYLHSALDFALGEYQANATVLARKFLNKYDFENDIHSNVIKATFLLLKQEIVELNNIFHDVVSHKDEFELNLISKFESNAYDRNAVAEDTSHYITLEGIVSFSNYLRTGNNIYYTNALEKVKTSLSIFDTICDPDNFVITQLILLLIRQMYFCSIWHQLGDIHNFKTNPILLRYLNTLSTDSKKPIYELWDSQIKAVTNVLNSTNAIVLQMPTSAGKTRVAEIKIAQVLASSTGHPCKCIYVAPFKSLASQVEESLNYYLEKVGYRVTSVFGSYESVDFEDILAEQSDVLIITPEKLDYLLRQNKEYFQDVKLIAIDEGHLIDNEIRGLRLELLLYRLNKLYSQNGLQILFISAVLPNSEEIASWLSFGEPTLVKSLWRPTKLRQGIFYWDDKWIGRIYYEYEKLQIITDIEKILIQEYCKNNPTKKLKKPIFKPNTVYDIAIELALNFIKASPTIIFTAVRIHVDSIANDLYEKINILKINNTNFSLVSEYSKSPLELLARKVERRLGDNFPLAQYIREGFAYHHGYLPDDIKVEIENSFRNEYIRILIATPTLAQGVNLPVHLMIVANLNRGDKHPFLIRDFRNIAGRAGRALHETEGNVIFVQNTQSKWLVGQMRKYLRDDTLEKVKSVLFELYTNILKRKLNKSLEEFIANAIDITFDAEDATPQTEIESTFQTCLLALLYEELIDESDPITIQKMIDDTLFGHQWVAERTYYHPLVNFTNMQIRYISEQFRSDNQKKSYYRTGFSMKSCKSLEEAIRILVTQNVFNALRDENKTLNLENLTSILKLIYIPSETSNRTQDDTIIKAMIDWINFADINLLKNNYEKSNAIFQDPLKITDLVYRHFSNDAPWTLNAVNKILNYLKEDEHLSISNEIIFLPAYMKYGVNNPISAYICGMGITNRNVAKIISEYYYSLDKNESLIPNLDEFKEWIQDLNFEDLNRILINKELVLETWLIIRKYKLDSSPIDTFIKPDKIIFLTYLVGLQYENRLELLKDISEGDKLDLTREPENTFDSYALAVYSPQAKKIGYIRSSKAFILSTLINEGRVFSCTVETIKADTNPNRKLLLNVSEV